MDRNLKVVINLSFKTQNYVEILEKLCQGIHVVKPIKGLRINLICFDDDVYNESLLPAEEVKEVLDKYSEICNLKVFMYNRVQSLEYIKVDGEKQQFYIDTY